MDQIIWLPFGGSFPVNELVEYVESSGRNYIIQGQTKSSFADHAKHQSLDYWLRVNFAKNKNAMLANNSVIEQLVNTGLFQEGKSFICPDKGTLCKGVKLIHS